MNRYVANQDDELLFERLADGELCGDEYRRLIASLDDRPNGWKRCALALLEAQTLAGELRAVAEVGSMGPRPVNCRHPVLRTRNVNLATLVAAVAASFLIAFGLGVWLRGGLSGADQNRNSPNVAEGIQSAPGSIGGSAVSADGSMHTAANGDPYNDAAPPLPRGRMTLVLDDGTGQGSEIQLPVYDVSQIDESWFVPREFPPAVVQSLRQDGYELQRDRQVLPFEMNGHQVLVPMEQVQIVPVSATYQ
jgi:hypothetical protein